MVDNNKKRKAKEDTYKAQLVKADNSEQNREATESVEEIEESKNTADYIKGV